MTDMLAEPTKKDIAKIRLNEIRNIIINKYIYFTGDRKTDSIELSIPERDIIVSNINSLIEFIEND